MILKNKKEKKEKKYAKKIEPKKLNKFIEYDTIAQN